MEPLVKLLKMLNQDPKLAEYIRLRSKLILENESLKELQQLRAEGKLSSENFDELKAETIGRVEKLELTIKDLQLADASLKDLQMREARLRVLEKKKDSLLSMGKQGVLDQHNFETLMLEIDEKIDLLNNRHEGQAQENAAGQLEEESQNKNAPQRQEPGAQAET